MAAPWWLPFGDVPELAPDEVLRLVEAGGVQLVDVRTSLEFGGGHIEGAVSVPIIDFPSRWRSLGLDASRLVVTICLSAHRSIPAVRLLRQQGFDAKQLKGGMLAWRAAKLPEVKG